MQSRVEIWDENLKDWNLQVNNSESDSSLPSIYSIHHCVYLCFQVHSFLLSVYWEQCENPDSVLFTSPNNWFNFLCRTIIYLSLVYVLGHVFKSLGAIPILGGKTLHTWVKWNWAWLRGHYRWLFDFTHSSLFSSI